MTDFEMIIIIQGMIDCLASLGLLFLSILNYKKLVNKCVALVSL